MRRDGSRPLADLCFLLHKYRMKTSPFSAALIALLICATSTIAAAKARELPEDQKRFVSVVQNLEIVPLNPELQHDRAWAIQWLTDAPDISVNVCLDPIGGVAEKSYARGPNVVVQYMLAMAAFIIKNPDKQNDMDAQQLAGVESALRAYQSMRTAQPLASSPALEKLLEVQKRGELPGFVHEAYLRCLAKGSEEVAPTSAPAKPLMWEKIWDQPSIAVIYVDRSSVTGSSELRSLATRTVYKMPIPEGYIAERVRIEEFDCTHHRSRIRSVTIVANDGRSLQTIDWAPGKSDWETYENDSLGAAKNEIACTPTAHAE
jgi:hypothetical protein